MKTRGGVVCRETQAAICSDAFGVTADAMAELRGAPGYRYATTPHPVAVLTGARNAAISMVVRVFGEWSGTASPVESARTMVRP